MIGSLAPREVDPGALFGGRIVDGPLSEPDLSAFINHASSETFRAETVGTPTKTKEWDAAGWYCPIHFYGYDWGIYIRPQSVYEIAFDILAEYSDPISKAVIKQSKEKIPLFERDETISEDVKEIRRKTSGIASAMSGRFYHEWLDRGYIRPIGQCIISAYFVLFHHELFHHLSESFGLRAEFISGNPTYVSYSDSVYKRAKGTGDHIEEALANAFAFRAVEDSRFAALLSIRPTLGADMQTVVLNYLRKRFPSDPPGYNRALEFVSDDGFDRGIGLLLAQMKEANIRPLKTDDASALRGEFTPIFGEAAVRCVEVPESRGQRVLPGASLPFDNRGKRLQKLLQSKGFILKRQGEHEVWAKDGFPPIPVPRTKDLADGTVESILKKIDRSFRVRNFEQIMRGMAA
jgi:predicted RNA binding protein YcfA (HicA-like mRNA interferase family)